MSNGTNNKIARNYKNHKVLTIDDKGMMDTQQVLNIDGNSIETTKNIYYLSDAKQVFDLKNKGFTFIYNLDLPSKVEAQNLKQLRRSSALNNLLNFEGDKSSKTTFFVMAALLAITLIFK